MPSYRKYKLIHLDWPLFIAILIVTILGLTILYSSQKNLILLQQQSLRLLLGFFLLIIAAQFPPQYYRLWGAWLYWFTVILLICVLLNGYISKGAQRWLNLGILRFQPAELMKLALPMYLAGFFAHRPLPPRLLDIIKSLVIILIPVILIILQPDLGTAILLSACGGFILFFAGIYWNYLLYGGLLITCCLPVMWTMMHEYQRERILTLLSPERDPLGKGYHIIQSKIAIGSGGLQGKGWLGSTQSSLEYLPERTTDFIFAVYSEEFGLLGILLLFGLYLFIIFRCLTISLEAKNSFARLLASGLAMTFFMYVFVNIGMVSGILPVVGIPLPLISYGGSALLTLMLAFGMLMSINNSRNFG